MASTSGHGPRRTLAPSTSFELTGCLINESPPPGLADQPCILVLQEQEIPQRSDSLEQQDYAAVGCRYVLLVMKGATELVRGISTGPLSRMLTASKEHLDLSRLHQISSQASPTRVYTISFFKQFRGVVKFQYQCPMAASKYGEPRFASFDPESVRHPPPPAVPRAHEVQRGFIKGLSACPSRQQRNSSGLPKSSRAWACSTRCIASQRGLEKQGPEHQRQQEPLNGQPHLVQLR